MFIILPGVYVILFCFRQIPLNLTLVLVPKWFDEGLRKLGGAEGDLIF